MITIDKKLINDLFNKAVANPRLRQNFDMRTSSDDSSQRMLNALMPGTKVAIHRHPNSSENVICICGKLDEVFYDAEGNEAERITLCPAENKFGCVVPANTWHTVEVLEPSVIYEAKDGKYGEDGSENYDDYVSSQNISPIPDNCLGDLKQQITYLIGMERQSGNMDVMTPLYISRMLNVPLEEVEQCIRDNNLL